MELALLCESLREPYQIQRIGKTWCVTGRTHMSVKWRERERLVKQTVFYKRGRPLLISADLDKQVQAYISELRLRGGVVNTAVVIAAGMGMVKSYDANMLSSNGGSIDLGKDWAKSLMKRMNLSKQKATTKASTSSKDFGETQEIFLPLL